MPLWYMGPTPLNNNEIGYNGYAKSLVSQSLSQEAVTARINAGFSAIRYALNSELDIFDSLDANVGLAKTELLTSMFKEGDANRKVTTASIGTGGGPLALGANGKLLKTRLNIPSTQRWARGSWSPNAFSYPSNSGGETTIAQIYVNPGYSRYQLFITGTINVVTTQQDSVPIAYVRAGAPNGGAFAFGFASRESYRRSTGQDFGSPGGQSYTIPSWAQWTDVTVLGGGGGGGDGGAGFRNGGGGGAGGFASNTVSGPGWAGRTLGVYVGAGGRGGSNNGAASAGEASYVADVTWAPGGGAAVMPAVAGLRGTAGQSAAYWTSGGAAGQWIWNILNVSGYNVKPGNGGTGSGGGGAAGFLAGFGKTPGGSGGSGYVWIRSYGYLNASQISLFPTNGTVLTGPTTLYVNIAANGGTLYTEGVNPQISVMAVPF